MGRDPNREMKDQYNISASLIDLDKQISKLMQIGKSNDGVPGQQKKYCHLVIKKNI